VTGFATYLERFRNLDPSRKLILISAVGVFALIVWASLAQIDEVTQGLGKVIPSSKAQVVQAADAAVVKDILVRGGQSVKKGQLLVRLDDAQSSSELGQLQTENQLLQVQAQRLAGEASGNAIG
jgi:adhesin transport system membrane fusion protein